MSAQLNIEIVTPAKVVWSGIAEAVTLPGSKSPFQVLNGHAPIVSSLNTGAIKIQTNGNNYETFAIGQGFVEVNQNKVSVLVENADNTKDFDYDTVILELDKAKKTLENETEQGKINAINKQISYLKTKLKFTNSKN